MPNILMVTLPTTRHFKEKFLPCLLRFPKTKLCRKFENLKSLAQAVLKICSTVCQKF